MNKDIRIDVFFLKNLKTKKSRKKHGADFILCLIDLWAYCAINFPKGILKGLSCEDVDLIVEWNSEDFCEKAISEGWIDLIDNELHLHGWEERQGYAMFAEERSEKARNASKARWNSKNGIKESKEHATSNATSMQQAMLENANSNAPSPSPSPSPSPKLNNINYCDLTPNHESKIPNCPHDKIIALYHEILPECPVVKTWHTKRQSALRARWKDLFVQKKATDEKSGLEYFRKLFTHVRKSDFLMGKVHQEGRKPFLFCLEWGIKLENFTKMIEGRYDSW